MISRFMFLSIFAMLLFSQLSWSQHLTLPASQEQRASGPLRISDWNRKDNAYLYRLDFDINAFQQLNEDSLSMSQVEVNEALRAFLTTSSFFSSLEGPQYYRHDNISILIMAVDGKLNAPLLRAMYLIQSEDAETFYKLAPTAIKAQDDREAYRNMDTLYNCWALQAWTTRQDPNCENLERLTTLSPRDFEALKGSYIRPLRLRSLSFSHKYCEYNDPIIHQAVARSAEAVKTVEKIKSRMHSNAILTYIRNEEEIRKFVSLPVMSGRFSGVRMTVCQ